MYPVDLSSKKAIVFGVANERSIAWAICQILHQAGVRLAIAYQNERLRSRAEKLVQGMDATLLLECDVAQDEQIEAVFQKTGKEFGSLDYLVHSIAFAQREDLGGDFSQIGREGFQTALEISAYSLIPLVRHAATLMKKGGSVITMTFQASERVFPGYNIMGTAKAALENEVRQLAAEYGNRNIRVNAISAGPLETLAARGIHGFPDMRRIHAQKAPLQRNITHEEVAKTALYLCSDLSSGVTGAIIPVDAGYHIMAV
ncbi:MAG: enoyl-ACP reductase [Dehalococcoidia bacterium]